MQLRQFVVSRDHTTFAEVTESVKTFQELIEVDTVSHVFKNVTFSDRYMSHSNYNSTSSLCDVSNFVKRDGVTFDARRNQGFLNACTVK